MWAMPSTAPLSIKPRTRKQKSTTYGNRELKYITWVRRESSTLHSVAMDTLRGGFTLTHSSFSQTRVRREWIPQTTLSLFGAECASLWNLSKCEENSLRFREMSQKSSSQYFTGTFSAHLITGLLNLECKRKKNPVVLLTVVAGYTAPCCVTHSLDEDYRISFQLLPKEHILAALKQFLLTLGFFFFLQYCSVWHNVQDC